MTITAQAGPLIPAWVYAESFPKADEDALTRLADGWKALSEALSVAEEDVRGTARTLTAKHRGDANAAAIQQMGLLGDWLGRGSTGCASAAARCTEAATLVRVTKMLMNLLLQSLLVASFQSTLTSVAQGPLGLAGLADKLRRLQVATQARLQALARVLIARLSGLTPTVTLIPEPPGTGKTSPGEVDSKVATLSGSDAHARGMAERSPGDPRNLAADGALHPEQRSTLDLGASRLLDLAVTTEQETGGLDGFGEGATGDAISFGSDPSLAPPGAGQADGGSTFGPSPEEIDSSADDPMGIDSGSLSMAAGEVTVEELRAAGLGGSDQGDPTPDGPPPGEPRHDGPAQDPAQGGLEPAGSESGTTGPSGSPPPGGPDHESPRTTDPVPGGRPLPQASPSGPTAPGTLAAGWAAPETPTAIGSDAGRSGGTPLAGGTAGSGTPGPLGGGAPSSPLGAGTPGTGSSFGPGSMGPGSMGTGGMLGMAYAPPGYPGSGLRTAATVAIPRLGPDQLRGLLPPDDPWQLIYQKVLRPNEAEEYLSGQRSTLRGLIHPAHQVNRLATPAEHFDALGLGFTVTVDLGRRVAPFHREARWIDVLRCQGIHEQDLVLPVADDWSGTASGCTPVVRDHGFPWTGTGFAPGSTSWAPIEEYELLGYTRLEVPHGSEIWRRYADGRDELIGTFDATNGCWNAHPPTAPQQPEFLAPNGKYATNEIGQLLPVQELGADRLVVLTEQRQVLPRSALTALTGVTTIGEWGEARVQILGGDGSAVLVDYLGDCADEAERLGFIQLNQGEWEPRWLPGPAITNRSEYVRSYS